MGETGILGCLFFFAIIISCRLKDKNISLKVEDDVKKHIVNLGFDKNYGARPLRRVVQNLIEDKITEGILDGNIKDGDNIKIVLKDGTVTINSEVLI